MRPVLIYPPLTDPTCGYHSLCYLDSYARAQGQAAATIIDANIEAFHHSYTDLPYDWLTRQASVPSAFDDRMSPGAAAAMRLRAGLVSPEQTADAVRVLRDPLRFYDYSQYQNAVETIAGWMNTLGAAGLPGQFHNGFEFQPYDRFNSSSVRDLTDEAMLARLSNAFTPYYREELLPRLVAGGHDVVGVNITFVSQLPFALWMARLIRRALPDAFLVAGGTEVSDVWKYALDKSMVFQIFDVFDALVVGEGETAYVEILDALDAGRLPSGHPNVRLHPRYGIGRALPMFKYEQLATLPTPDYSTLPWEQYLSPEPFVYYSPTRGCYWNKCTFCDYGLNGDSPTSPWRQGPVDKMVSDVTAISQFARFIYFSVDVLAPATILRFAERVVESELDFRWGAEIRLEKYWSVERCRTLKDSGCVSVSVGFESASQRILDLIDKGTTPAQVSQTIDAMTQAGIGVQMMGFTGFPSETADEAMESISFLREHRELWTFGGLGTFMLTAGAIVAKQPERFGLRNVVPYPDHDIARALSFEQIDGTLDEGELAKLEEAKAALTSNDLGRPWVGGTDCAHTYLYQDRYGMDILKVVGPAQPDRAARYVLNGTLIRRPEPEVVRQYQYFYWSGRNSSDRPGRFAFRRIDGRLYLIPDALVPLLQLFAVPRDLPAAELALTGVPPSVARQAWDFIVGRRLVRPEPPGSPSMKLNPPGAADGPGLGSGPRFRSSGRPPG
ncbi:B12-binding domain-containing radical SAM protein [Micromonospora eburnea]|uniref:B12 binding domain-containing protein n=1 Tax=Micromonospora eburnea TaxID=227316 RepID=A0A1C6UB61_9ACTN|nr:radical SAM protein [Micromonospora eburnea]SCL51133.1 B12 binding domain-containing protein [Micromonospora eburnea]